MQRGIVTKISVYEDLPTSVSSTAYGANLDCFAFNMGFIANKSPDLARQLMVLYEKCKKLKEK
jgi:hypothetical protein